MSKIKSDLLVFSKTPLDNLKQRFSAKSCKKINIEIIKNNSCLEHELLLSYAKGLPKFKKHKFAYVLTEVDLEQFKLISAILCDPGVTFFELTGNFLDIQFMHYMAVSAWQIGFITPTLSLLARYLQDKVQTCSTKISNDVSAKSKQLSQCANDVLEIENYLKSISSDFFEKTYGIQSD
jgi:hypothetical protein